MAIKGDSGRQLPRLLWGHGYWMPKLPVVECRICKGSGGFGRGVELFVGFGVALGCGVVFASWVLRFLRLDLRFVCRGFAAWICTFGAMGFAPWVLPQLVVG